LSPLSFLGIMSTIWRFDDACNDGSADDAIVGSGAPVSSPEVVFTEDGSAESSKRSWRTIAIQSPTGSRNQRSRFRGPQLPRATQGSPLVCVVLHNLRSRSTGNGGSGA